MKLNISNPLNNVQKSVEIDDEKKLLPFMERRIGNVVPGDSLGEEFAGYLFKITGGNDKQGFPMLQGVLTNHRVRLLFRKGMKCYRPRRKGERRRKSVRGCIVGQDLSALNLTLMKKGTNEIEGLTDKSVGKKLGPKRASKIRKLFNLDKTDDVRKYVIGRAIVKKGKQRFIKPKIQRLVTEKRLLRKKSLLAAKERRRVEKKNAIKEYKSIIKKYKRELLSKTEDDSTKKKKTIKTISKLKTKKDKKNKIAKKKINKEKTDKPKSDKAKTDKPKSDKAKTDKPKTDKTKTDKPKTDKTKTDKPKTDKKKIDKKKTDKPKTDKAKTDKAKTDKAKTDKPKNDKAKTDKPKTDKPKTDKAKTDKAKTDKAKTDKAKNNKTPNKPAQNKQKVKPKK
ncbi:40S ribosomal protein S6 [Hepatocystis sp. ex Piliocolobus tephrosceles]|nr:40S ribosomal protein S6 [Hepatocystis sp. ex Piliocolobus tephrosceles]